MDDGLTIEHIHGILISVKNSHFDYHWHINSVRLQAECDSIRRSEEHFGSLMHSINIRKKIAPNSDQFAANQSQTIKTNVTPMKPLSLPAKDSSFSSSDAIGNFLRICTHWQQQQQQSNVSSCGHERMKLMWEKIPHQPAAAFPIDN